ncbi:MAG: hypothetical protein IT206_04325 [Fimbriimonadaceae bacterium]|nr:hypothetical protein [Fimbriimonadaceae bacterium]
MTFKHLVLVVGASLLLVGCTNSGPKKEESLDQWFKENSPEPKGGGKGQPKDQAPSEGDPKAGAPVKKSSR